MARKRYYFIDVAKAIAIVLVVIGHWHPDNSPQWYEGVWKVIYSFHMPLFLMASGFLYMATFRPEQSYGQFLKKKVIRLLVPYITVSVLVISLKLLTQSAASASAVENPVTPMSYLRMFCYPEAGYFLWFIWTLITAFIIMPAFRTKWSRVAALLAAAIVAYLPSHFTKMFALEQSRQMFMYFVAGAVVFDFKDSLSSLRKVPFVATLTLFVIAEAIYLTDSFKPVTYILPFLGVATVFQLSAIIAERGNGGRGLGLMLNVSAASYTIYLLHTTFEGFAKAALGKFPTLLSPDNTLLFVVSSVVIIAVGVLVPYILHFYILSKWKVPRFLFSIK